MEVALSLILSIMWLVLITISYILSLELEKHKQFEELRKLNRTDLKDYSNFNCCYQEIKKRFALDDVFKIVYLKDGNTIIKINKNYYDVFETGMNLIINEDEYITKKFKDYCNE